MRFAADENIKGGIFKGLQENFPDLDIVRVQDTPLLGIDDPQVLAWAAEESRIILTHDVQTFVGYAYARIKEGLPMVGVILIPMNLSVGEALEDLIFLIDAGTPSDFDQQVIFLPLK